MVLGDSLSTVPVPRLGVRRRCNHRELCTLFYHYLFLSSSPQSRHRSRTNARAYEPARARIRPRGAPPRDRMSNPISNRPLTRRDTERFDWWRGGTTRGETSGRDDDRDDEYDDDDDFRDQRGARARDADQASRGANARAVIDRDRDRECDSRPGVEDTNSDDEGRGDDGRCATRERWKRD